jgi:hypothetical protein
MSSDPFVIDGATARFERFVTRPVTTAHEQALRRAALDQPLVLDLTDTITLSSEWWRLFGRIGARGSAVVVGATIYDRRMAHRVGADALEFRGLP